MSEKQKNRLVGTSAKKYFRKLMYFFLIQQIFADCHRNLLNIWNSFSRNYPTADLKKLASE